MVCFFHYKIVLLLFQAFFMKFDIFLYFLDERSKMKA